ncbi:hypothetical protein ACWCZ5_34555, partial [Streptomyces sp. NPDC001667]
LSPGHEPVEEPVIHGHRHGPASGGLAMFSLVAGALFHDRSYIVPLFYLQVGEIAVLITLVTEK